MEGEDHHHDNDYDEDEYRAAHGAPSAHLVDGEPMT